MKPICSTLAIHARACWMENAAWQFWGFKCAHKIQQSKRHTALRSSASAQNAFMALSLQATWLCTRLAMEENDLNRQNRRNNHWKSKLFHQMEVRG